jgi:hypothetical protein
VARFGGIIAELFLTVASYVSLLVEQFICRTRSPETECYQLVKLIQFQPCYHAFVDVRCFVFVWLFFSSLSFSYRRTRSRVKIARSSNMFHAILVELARVDCGGFVLLRKTLYSRLADPPGVRPLLIDWCPALEHSSR